MKESGNQDILLFAEEEEDAVLNVEPLKIIQDKERSRANAALLFLRKHAAVIKKNLLIQSINYGLRNQKKQERQSQKASEKSSGSKKSETESSHAII